MSVVRIGTSSELWSAELRWDGMDREAWEAAVRESAWATGLKSRAGAVAGLLLDGTLSFLELGRGVGAETPMEVGSVTKGFTGLLLADAVMRGEVDLESRVDEVIFAQHRAKPWPGAPAVTLLELATHTSGLPRLSMKAQVGLLGDPYRWYGEGHLLRYLERVQPRTPAEPKFAYSNLGFAILGLALERAAGKPYARLLQERVLDPLAMQASALQRVGTTLVTRGYNMFGLRAGPWHFRAYAPCGALVSTAQDLLRATTMLVDESGPLAGSLPFATEPRVRTPLGWVGLGWMQPESRRYVWHNGGTYGYSAYVAFSTEARAGVVLLANRFGAQKMTVLGHELMRGLTAK